jgi:peptidoglycan/xylan/chitin deacetylase (PgdA/CDA1 family)
MAEPPASRHPLDGLVTVMWHYVRTADDLPRVGATWVDPATLADQLDAIARQRTVVSWPEVAEALHGGRPLPPDAALLTFDDGLADLARTVAPLLVARGWRGIFFVLARDPGEPLTVGHAIHILLAELGEEGLAAAVLDALPPAEASRFVAAQARERAAGVAPLDVLKRPLQRDLLDVVEPILQRLVTERVGPPGEVADALHLSPVELERMRRDGLTIGGHGLRHLWFDHAPAARVRDEVAATAAFLAREPRPWPFAYPYGASGPGAVRALGEHGFGGAFHASPTAARGAFDLGRVDGEDHGLGSAIAAAGSITRVAR